MRFILLALMAVLSSIPAWPQTVNLRSRAKSTPKIELRLIPEKRAIHPGETLKLRVEVWNVGDSDVIIAQNVDATYGNSELTLILQSGSAREVSRGIIADSIPEPNPDFEQSFVTNWLTLNRAHFYGTYVHMGPIDFPHLRRPGYYKVSAEYYSRGISSTSGWNGGYLKQEDVDKLPLMDLKGALTSNVVPIQVTPSPQPPQK